MLKLGTIKWLIPPLPTPRKPSTSSPWTMFYPFNTQVTAHNKLLALRQMSFKEKNGETNDGFQQYITNFQNLSMKSGMKEELSLISQFSLGLDQKITSMILSMSPLPTTVKGWINQAKVFHTQKMHILSLHQGRITPQIHSPSHPHHDPNAMDVDAITLSKLTPVKLAKCIKEGRCFRCRKAGHNAQNCHTSSPSQSSPSLPCPQQIRVTHTQPELLAKEMEPKD